MSPLPPLPPMSPMSPEPPSPPAGRGAFVAAAVATLGTRAIDLPTRYGFHLLVAGKLGVAGAGAFYIVFGVLTLGAGLGRLGIDRAMTREVAAAMAMGEHARARAVIWRGMGLIGIFSLAAGGALALAAPIVAGNLFGDLALRMPIILAGVTLMPLCLGAGLAGVLAGLHKVEQSQMIYSWAWPALFCGMAVFTHMDLARAFALLLAATGLVLALAMVLVWRQLPAAGEARAAAAPRLIGLGWALFTTEIVQIAMAALPALVLGLVASQAQVGAFAMAWRLALALNLLVVALAAMAAPRYAAAHARADHAALASTATSALALTFILGTVPLVVLAACAPWLLGLFGEGFADGALAMRILLGGQVLLMLAATTPEMLGMAGLERAMQRVNLLAMLAYVPLLLGLGSISGAVGAATAMVASALITAAGSTIVCWRHLGFVPLVRLVVVAGARVRRARGRG